jgi:hypothetical protein
VEICLTLDVSQEGARARLHKLQTRLSEACHPVFASSGTSQNLFIEIRRYLSRASDQRLLTDSLQDIRRKLVISNPDPSIPGSTHSIGIDGPRNFRRDPALPHFARYFDKARIDFQISTREHGGSVEILAYAFELILPAGAPLQFVRFDLNHDKHPNATLGLRSHIHLSTDDDGYSVPSAMLSPFEVFDIFLHRIRSSGRVRSASSS